jgi:hypothetical protein
LGAPPLCEGHSEVPRQGIGLERGRRGIKEAEAPKETLGPGYSAPVVA